MPRFLALALSLFIPCVASQASAAERSSLESDVTAATSGSPSEAQAAIGRLRAAGPAGFEALLSARDEAGEHERFDEALDAVGGARYCSVSRLYWHTDHQQALAEAERTGKPILALRMMGNLTDEFSCANSRFFRTTLYANEEIGKNLRDNFVLAWKSVRPVPKVTVDFGDGRKLERTLTGNSIHYVVAPDGTVIDGLPGLHSPQKFQAWLSTAGSFAKSYHDADEATREQYRVALRTSYHARAVSRILRAWRADLDRLDATEPETTASEIAAALEALRNAAPRQQPAAVPTARAAALIARPKAAVELPLIANVTLETSTLSERTNAETWEKLAALHADDVALDASSIAVIVRENPAFAANAITETKRKVESPLLRMLTKLQRSIAVDTVRNEYDLHRRLHQWFADGTAPADLEELNEKVYAELFLTPSSDPWIGLAPADVYTGLENGGVVVER